MPDTRTIQKQIIDAIASTISASVQQRGATLTVIDNGNGSIDYEHDTVTKTLSVTIEAYLQATGANIATAEYLDQLDQVYGDTLVLLMAGDQTFGGLVDEFREVPVSPEYDLRGRGSDTLTMRMNFEAIYRHNAGDPRSQTNSDY